MKRAIGFFDSGVGGLSVLKEARRLMPEENYIYFGDSANAPYGEKTPQEVKRLTMQAVRHLCGQNIKALVIACNTATSICVDELRKEADFPIISMEPAIKPALEKTTGKVLLLATEVTLASGRVNDLIARFDTQKRVIKVPAVRLAGEIEKEVFSHSDLDGYLDELLLPYGAIRPTAIVLGCTHYPFVKNRIALRIPGAAVFDGINGTVSRLREVLFQNGLKNTSVNPGSLKMESSKTDTDTEFLYQKLLNGGLL